MSGVLTLIKDLVVGAQVTTHGLVTDSKVSQTKTGKDLVRFTLADASSTVGVTRFDFAQAPEVGEVLEVNGLVEEFNGLQIKAESWRSCVYGGAWIWVPRTRSLHGRLRHVSQG
jgi:hypothetical protein